MRKDTSKAIRADRDAIMGSMEEALQSGHSSAWAALEVAAQLADLREAVKDMTEAIRPV
jgi:hypothetical protein